MAIAVQSTATTTTSGATAFTVTKPTGLAVGDLMICVASIASTTAAQINTASGWTSADLEIGNEAYTKIQYKVADSGDVSASDFTFTNTADVLYGVASIMRVTGVPSSSLVDVSSSQNTTVAATTTISFSTTLAVATNGSLLIMAFSGVNQGTDGAGTMSTYVASDGSLSWTELHDASTTSGTRDPIFGAAYAIQGTKATITSYGATLSLSRVDHVGVMTVVKPITNASGTSALHSADADFFAPTASSGSTGSNALLQADADHFAPAAKGTSPSQWTPETKTSTTWATESKPSTTWTPESKPSTTWTPESK